MAELYQGRRDEPLPEYRDREERTSVPTGPMPELFTSAYVQNGRLTIVGLSPGDAGVVPFTFKAKIEGEDIPPDGPIHLGAGNLHPAIVKILTKAEGPIMAQIDKKRMGNAAQDLVDRARLGEQNAQAMLVAVRQNAERGIPRAKLMLALCLAYAKAPQSTALATVGNDRAIQKDSHGPISTLKRALAGCQNANHYAATVATHVPAAGGSMLAAQSAATALSHGPTINGEMLTCCKQAIGSGPAQNLFVNGYKLSANPGKVLELASAVAQETKDPELMRALQTGYSLGLAKRLQAVRGGAPLKVLSSQVAWELGEQF